jgi:hypothetical protein
MIGGDDASKRPEEPNATSATNRADQITSDMARDGMVFNGTPDKNKIVGYTHGMIQAIYKAYSLGVRHNCTPYEIAVGSKTKKMASCIPCTLFMYAVGYPPNSIHLGRGESWTPLYTPYNPDGSENAGERQIIRDLNNVWYEKCRDWLTLGLEILNDSFITDSHRESRVGVRNYLNEHTDPTVGGVLILDALTIHDTELRRMNRTLKPYVEPD